MSDEEYSILKDSGKYAKESKVLLRLNELYHEYLYLMSFNDLIKKRNEVKNRIAQ